MNKEKLIFCLFLVLLVLGVQSCISEPAVPISAGSPVLIDSKAQIKNDNDTNTVSIQIALMPQKAIRMEITATLGVSVASVLLTPNKISYALHSSKQFVEGPFHEKTLYPVFKKNINPQLLWKVIHSQSPADNNFKCELNAQSQPLFCKAQDGSTVKWLYENGLRKRIDIISDRFEMSWVFKDISPLSEYHNETFVLKKPEDYKEIIIK